MEAHIHPVLSPLQLNKYFIKRLTFWLNEGFDRQPRPTRKEIRAHVMPEMGIDVRAEQNPDNTSQWRIEVSIELGESEDQSFPYKVAGTVVGYFQVDKKLPQHEANDLAKVSGASILYSAMREIIKNATGKAQYPYLMLPTVSFVDLPELLEDGSNKAPTKPPRKAAAKKRASKTIPAARKK